MQTYNRAFYEHQRDGSYRSAGAILPYVLQLIKPRSVIDFGCGVGTWLRVCKENHVPRVVGVDGGSPHKSGLLISATEFVSADLCKPLDLKERFDLAISLEVAEHIPREYETVFLDSLTIHSKVILFSGGIPHWGGKGHVNEQWQSYWIERFCERGYSVIDCLRARFWESSGLAWWYKHATFLFVEQHILQNDDKLVRLERECSMPWNVVHPKCHLGLADPKRLSVRRIARALLSLPNRMLSR